MRKSKKKITYQIFELEKAPVIPIEDGILAIPILGELRSVSDLEMKDFIRRHKEREMSANERFVLTMIVFKNILDGRRVSFMQRKHSPILISHETAKLIVGNMMNSKTSMQKKAFVKESLVVASKVNTKELRIMG